MLKALHRLIFEVSCILFGINRYNDKDIGEYQEQEFTMAANNGWINVNAYC
jgi:hypothetical protein